MTTTETTATMSLRVWPGCLSCYNAGRLVGAWIDAADAGELTVERLHQLAGAPLRVGCEEIWCLDGDGPWPGFHEMGLSEAQEWADAYAEVEPWLWPALSAWVASGAYVAAGNGSVPVPSDFIDHLHGEFDSWADFVEHWLTETSYMDRWPEAAQTYFDAEKFGRDLAFDFTNDALAVRGRLRVLESLSPTLIPVADGHGDLLSRADLTFALSAFQCLVQCRLAALDVVLAVLGMEPVHLGVGVLPCLQGRVDVLVAPGRELVLQPLLDPVGCLTFGNLGLELVLPLLPGRTHGFQLGRQVPAGLERGRAGLLLRLAQLQLRQHLGLQMRAQRSQHARPDALRHVRLDRPLTGR